MEIKDDNAKLVRVAKGLVASNDYFVMREKEMRIYGLVQDDYCRSYPTEEEARKQGEKIGYPVVMTEEELCAYEEAVRTVVEITQKVLGKPTVIH